jgi:hypothetical protein
VSINKFLRSFRAQLAAGLSIHLDVFSERTSFASTGTRHRNDKRESTHFNHCIGPHSLVVKNASLCLVRTAPSLVGP